MKEFAIIGLGNFGATVARELALADCRVTAIDSNKTAVQNLQDELDLAIIADATERAFLANLEVEKFDCFVVSTGSDSHASILITLHLKELGAKRIVVKANTSDHARILTKVGASEALIPEKMMATRLANSLSGSNLLDYLPLTGEYYVVELHPPSKFVDRTLKQLDIRAKFNCQIIAIREGESGEINPVPDGEYVIGENDILFALGKSGDIEKMKE
ncbi:MAG: TrkA family potassium uptake protein [candidate division Zixibacteria bacterium]|nr:TrkA family potassium uptake protein [candidate division Zixibacteria bacterium]